MNFQWNTEHWNIDSVSYPSHVPIPRQETNQNFSKMDFQWNKPSENVKQHSCEIGVCRNRVNCRQLQILGMGAFLGFVCILILAISTFEQPSDPSTSTGETVFFSSKISLRTDLFKVTDPPLSIVKMLILICPRSVKYVVMRH